MTYLEYSQTFKMEKMETLKMKETANIATWSRIKGLIYP